MTDWFAQSWPWWLVLATLLGIAELAVPGVFLAFVALAAAIVGVLAMLFPELGLAGEIAAFGAWSVVTVLVGRRWYRDYPVDSADPLLNDRAARLLGQAAVVADPIVAGRGRVRVGDGEWPARGPDLAAGARVRIVGIADGTLTVAPQDD